MHIATFKPCLDGCFKHVLDPYLLRAGRTSFHLGSFFVFPEDKTRPGLCLKAAAHLFSEAGLQGAQIEVTASFLQCFGSTLWKWETAAKPSHRKCWIPGSYFV